MDTHTPQLGDDLPLEIEIEEVLSEEEIEIEEIPREEEIEQTAPQSLTHDSMVTVRLSEPPPALTVVTGSLRKEHTHTSGEQSSSKREETPDTAAGDGRIEEESPRITMMDPNGEVLSPTGSESTSERDVESRRGSDSSEGSEGGGINWEELEKTEEQEPRDESSDDVSMLPCPSVPC